MRALLLPCLLLLAACSGGGDWVQVDNGLSPTSAYRVLDLATGTATAADDVSDLLTNPLYRTTHMVFRRVPAGTTVIGAAPGEVGAQPGETRGTASVDAFYLAALECSQQQWATLTGTTPWSGLSVPGATVIGATLPAIGLDQTTAAAALAGVASGRLRLPTDTEWERACRADTTTAYAWGDSTDGSTAAAQAQVLETRTAFGPQVPGSRSANAFGLYDLHGNAWELTSDGHHRGGSWAEPVSLARAANRADNEAVPHALVGVRLAMDP